MSDWNSENGNGRWREAATPGLIKQIEEARKRLSEWPEWMKESSSQPDAGAKS